MAYIDRRYIPVRAPDKKEYKPEHVNTKRSTQHSHKPQKQTMIEVSLTVGKLDASLALLLTKEHHLIEFPTVLLPDGVAAGSVVTIKCEQNHELEQQEAQEFETVQDEILQLFGTHEPKTPNLRVKNVTQTSAVLEWDALDLGSSSIKSLTLYKNGQRLGQVPNPLSNTTSKLSGLPVDTPYEFHLRLDTTAGVYVSEKVKVHTHKMTDLSGITVCLGDIDPSEGISSEDIETSLKNIGGRPIQTEVAVDTTHFVATVGLGAQWKKAVDSNIPVVRPEWLKACEEERRIVGVRNFYLDADPKFLAQHTFNKIVEPKEEPKEAEPVKEEIAKEEEPAAAETNGETALAVKETPVEETPVEEVSLEDTPVDTEEIVEESVAEDPAVETTSQPIEEHTASEEEAKEEEKLAEEETKEEEELTEKPIEEPATEEPVPEAVEEPVEESVQELVQEPTQEPAQEPAQEPTPAEEPVEEPATEEKFDDVDINATEETPKTETVIPETTLEVSPEGTPEPEGEEEDDAAEEETIPTPTGEQIDAKTQNSGKNKNKKKKKKGKK